MPLTFSRDTVLFDTVFTSRGSATRSLKVYNHSSSDIEVNIRTESEMSFFRLNVDGVSEPPFRNVVVPALDSIYIFMEVTIDPDQAVSVSPFVIEENLLMETSYAIQKVLLTAWGQNANYITPEERKGNISLLSCDFQEVIWGDPKPYVIYGVLVVDSCSLVLPKGTDVYIHGGVVNNQIGIYNDGLIYFGAHGRLRSEGSPEEPVLIQGDRLEQAFDEVPGQWNGMRLGPDAYAEMEYTIIKNAVNALVLDSASSADLKGCQIINSSGLGLAARHASLSAVNCLFANAGLNPVRLIYGGNYDFEYCTTVNYGRTNQALLANNFSCNDPDCNEISLNRLELTMVNSIVAGSTEDQLALINASEQSDLFQLYMSHNLLRVEDLLDDYPDLFEAICQPCWNFEKNEPLFTAPFEGDFELDSLSQALDSALILPNINTDALGRPRDLNYPDLGCFERLEQ